MNLARRTLTTLASISPRLARSRTAFGMITLGLLTILILGISIPAAHAQTYNEQTVLNFSRTDGTGDSPFGGLVQINGILYGTTSNFYEGENGTIFSLNPKTQVLTTLHSFIGSDGSEPFSGLTIVGSKLYGTTASGGANGEGTIFSINPDGTGFQTLYSFLGKPTDGASPQAALLNVNGTLYGTTVGGGNLDSSGNEMGTVFSFNPQTKVETNLHSFTGLPSNSNLPYDGESSYGSLEVVNGVLYGVTLMGGLGNGGTIFSLNPDGTNYQVVYTFAPLNIHDAQSPYGGLVDVNGILYGTTEEGGTATNGSGTIYAFDPASRQETTLYRFTGGNDGSASFGSLINVNGVLYGTSFNGGIDTDSGAVFAYNLATGTETPLHDFDIHAGDGITPRAGLLNVNGVLYGTAAAGGIEDWGTVFSLTPIVAPVAKNDACTVKYNTARTNSAPGVLANDNAGYSTTLTAALVSTTIHGTLTLGSDGSFTYTPNKGYAGTDTFTYQAVNSVGKSNTATVFLTIAALVPTAHNDACTITYNKARTNAAPGVLANDDNGGSTPMTAVLVTNPAHGTVTLGSDGSFTYTPNTGYVGTDSFTYQAVNPVGKSNIATVTLTVIPTTPTAKNDACTIAHNKVRTNAAPGVLGNDDNGGAAITAALVSNVTHGTLTLGSDGSFTYTPNTGYSGTDTFTYQAINSVGKSNVATVTLNVQ